MLVWGDLYQHPSFRAGRESVYVQARRGKLDKVADEIIERRYHDNMYEDIKHPGVMRSSCDTWLDEEVVADKEGEGDDCGL